MGATGGSQALFSGYSNVGQNTWSNVDLNPFIDTHETPLMFMYDPFLIAVSTS